VFNKFLFEVDATNMEKEEVDANLISMLKIRFSKQSPRRPPKVIIQGTPGSGRTTQAKMLAQKYGLVRVSTEELLQKVVNENPAVGKVITQAYATGTPVPDAIINSLVEQRLKESDCRVNGWVMEGFPETEA
jgi:adenylate kinase